MGLVPKAKTFGALELGTWVHSAFQDWYGQPNRGKEGLSLTEWFESVAETDILAAQVHGAPQFVIDKAEELVELGKAMMGAYEKRYGSDPGVNVLAVEIPLEFTITLAEELVAVHKLKPDMVYSDEHGDVWLMEHKTAAQIRLEHLPIDDQARPYVAMAEPALRKAGIISRGQQFKGVMYNFVRKALPDERETNALGQALNKNGSVSARQPTPTLIRHPVTLSRAARAIALRRLRIEATLVTSMTRSLREKRIEPLYLPKTPHSSCPKLCPFFTMCVVEEQGGDIKSMQRDMYVKRDPYLYDEDTTDIPPSFELS